MLKIISPLILLSNEMFLSPLWLKICYILGCIRHFDKYKKIIPALLPLLRNIFRLLLEINEKVCDKKIFALSPRKIVEGDVFLLSFCFRLYSNQSVVGAVPYFHKIISKRKRTKAFHWPIQIAYVSKNNSINLNTKNSEMKNNPCSMDRTEVIAIVLRAALFKSRARERQRQIETAVGK